MEFFNNPRMRQQQQLIYSLEQELKRYHNSATATAAELKRIHCQLEGAQNSNAELSREIDGLKMRCAGLNDERKKLLEEREASTLKIGVAMKNFHAEINMRRQLENIVAGLRKELAESEKSVEHLENLKKIQSATQTEFREVAMELDAYLASFRRLLARQGLSVENENPEAVVGMVAQLVEAAGNQREELRQTKHRLHELQRIVGNVHGSGGRVLRSQSQR